jgi:hypothetical protein
MGGGAISGISHSGKDENARDVFLPHNDAEVESLRERRVCFSLWGTILETCGRCDDVYIKNVFYEFQFSQSGI